MVFVVFSLQFSYQTTPRFFLKPVFPCGWVRRKIKENELRHAGTTLTAVYTAQAPFFPSPQKLQFDLQKCPQIALYFKYIDT